MDQININEITNELQNIGTDIYQLVDTILVTANNERELIKELTKTNKILVTMINIIGRTGGYFESPEDYYSYKEDFNV